ncbi:MAG: hypothetical protein KAJ19_29575 [Gammaproteobacteria bacterium]|nr:hypothetical protein [Gammaproteobacteria bacterium]
MKSARLAKIPESIHKQLRKIATEEKTTTGEIIVSALRDWLETEPDDEL